MTTLIEPLTKEEKIQRVLGKFHSRNWRCKRVDKRADVYMVSKPDFSECCYFIVFRSDDRIGLLPKETSEGFKECQKIIKEALK